MKEEIFRKKSLERIKSPDSLNEYIRVANPGVWLLLLGVIALLIGACVWGAYGHVDSTVPCLVRVDDGKAVCYVTDGNITSVTVGMPVKYAGQENAICDIGAKEDEGYACELEGVPAVSEGLYEGKVVVKRYRPMSFILN